MRPSTDVYPNVPGMAQVVRAQELAFERFQNRYLIDRAAGEAARLLGGCVGENGSLSLRGRRSGLAPWGREYKVVSYAVIVNWAGSTGGDFVLCKDGPRGKPTQICHAGPGSMLSTSGTCQDRFRFVEDVLAELPRLTPILENNALNAEGRIEATKELEADPRGLL